MNYIARSPADGEVVLRLCQHRHSIADLALALNCAGSMVRTLLARPFRSLYARTGKSVRSLEPLNLKMMPETESRIVPNSPTVSEAEIARERERLAQQLAGEIQRWLCTFEASDQDRQCAIDQAGLLLDESPLTADGKFHFDADRIIMEFLHVWSPCFINPDVREFGKVVGSWLALWIHFWITDTIVWNRALDLEYAHFDTTAQAA